ncbi:MAG: hypothetical protein ACOYOU_06815 [Kiritimatiellia bacterium]
MRGKLKHLPKPVVRTLLSFYLRTRFYELLRALLAPLVCYAVLALLATHLDRFLFLDTPDRLLISGWTHGICLVAGVLSLGLFAWRNRSVSRVAYDLESRLPKSAAERLVTLDDVLAREAAAPGKADSVHAAMVAQLTSETVMLCQKTPHAGRLVRDRRLKRWFGLLALLALLWAGLLAVPAYQFPLMLERLTFPNRNLAKPSFMKLIVTPESAAVGRGGEVVLQVQVKGAIPALLQRPMAWLGVDPSRCLLATVTGQVTRLAMGPDARPMSRVQSRLFVASRSDLQESFSYRVRCGDAQTDIRLVRVIAQPRVRNAYVLVDSPAYTGLKTARFDDLRDAVPAFIGSTVKVSFASDQSPLKSARLVNLRDSSTIADLKPDPKTGTYHYEFKMETPLEMEVVLVNELEFENVERVSLAVVVREDQSPTVRLEYPGGEVSVMQGELVPMQMEMADDLGLLEGAICYQVNAGRNADASPREIILPVEENKLTQSLAASLDLAKVDAVPGDEVLLWVRVRDTGRNDARAPAVRIHVTAFSGNDNERRRLAALRIVEKLLVAVEPSAADRNTLSLNEAAYEPIATSANGQGLALNPRAAPESMLDFLECEHFFTDSADAAMELLQLHGVIAGQFRQPPAARASVEARQAALRRLAGEILPALAHERMGRDLIRRAFSLRAEIQATTSASDAPERKNRAAQDRRMDLLLESLGSTGDDLAALARLSPQLLKVDEVLAFTRQISRTGRDLKHADAVRQQAAGKVLCEQIDGWIGLLLQPLPEWKAQRLAARAALHAQYEETYQLMRAGWQKSGSQAPPAAITGWLAANARMIERSPFAGLGERLATISPAGAATNAAATCEASVLARMASGNDFADWLSSARLTLPERRLAVSLQALDLADNDTTRTAAAQGLRLLATANDEADPGRTIPAAPPAFRGLYAQLPVLSAAATAHAEPYEKTIEALGARTASLKESLAKIGAPTEAEGFQGLSGLIPVIESGLFQWEAEAQRLIYRMHLDLAYGDPRREETARLATALPTLRAVLDQYQAVVPPLLNRLKGRLQRSARAENLSAVEGDGKELELRVSALGNKVKLAVKQLRGEAGGKERENEAVREMRLCYQAARQLAETNNPAAVAEAYFARNPAAAAMVLDSRMGLLRDLRKQIQVAGEALRTQSATSTVYRSAMQQAVQCVSAFEQQLSRFAALDADGVVRAKATEVRKRTETLIQPGRETGLNSLPRDRMIMDELQRLAAQFENQASEVVAKYRPSQPRGWRGGPAGAWDEVSRRDAEHARRRIMAQYERARREIILGFDAALTQRGQNVTTLADEPLASALLAWRTLHSSLGNGANVIPPPDAPLQKDELLLIFLKKQLDEMQKVLRQNENSVRSPYMEPQTRWAESMGGALRR